MTIKSKSLFILIGDDKTGKTTLQKLLIEKLCGYTYLKLPVNQTYIITHPEIKRKYRNISFANRSYQEKIGDYVSIDNYFKNHFQPAETQITPKGDLYQYPAGVSQFQLQPTLCKR